MQGKDNSKAAASASSGIEDSIGRVKVATLPKDVRILVSSAQNRLRLQIALKSAWTKEMAVPSARLPTSDDLIRTSLREAVRDSRGKANSSTIQAAYNLLQDEKGRDNTATEALRKKVYSKVCIECALHYGTLYYALMVP